MCWLNVDQISKFAKFGSELSKSVSDILIAHFAFNIHCFELRWFSWFLFCVSKYLGEKCEFNWVMSENAYKNDCNLWTVIDMIPWFVCKLIIRSSTFRWKNFSDHKNSSRRIPCKQSWEVKNEKFCIFGNICGWSWDLHCNVPEMFWEEI